MSENNMDSRIGRQPNKSDPQEIAIRAKLKNTLLSTELAKTLVNQTRNLQEKFFLDAFSKLDKPGSVYRSYERLVQSLSDICKSTIVSGSENIEKISSERGVIIVTNHLGLIKLTKIDNLDQKFPIPLESFEPFPLRHAPFLPIAKMLGAHLRESAIELPYPLSDIQKVCKIVIVSSDGNGRTQKLINDTNKLLGNEKSAIVMYPEGGTSGKRNNGGPYDLDTFHTGPFVVASQLDIPTLPVCQIFNPNKGFEIIILPPIFSEYLKINNFKDIATDTKNKMQNLLDQRAN